MMGRSTVNRLLLGAALFLCVCGSAEAGCYIANFYNGIPNEVCTPGTGTGVPVNPDKWVAIAVSDKTLAYGFSWQANSAEEAERKAMSFCLKSASDCKVKITQLNMCLALAESVNDLTWGVDSDRNGKRAQAKALAQCRKYNGRDCRVVADPCSHDE
jgi:hypothetical protein